MNEKIRELVEQIVGPSRLHGGEFALMGNNQVEKFAELIVQECIQIAEGWSEAGPNDRDAADEIREHFGVK